jgi:hypothetical protein
MKWATVFQQVAARPDAVAEIARLNGTTAAEILSQVELQTSCVGSNYDLARKAKDALAREAKKASEADEADREASRRAEEAKKRQEELRERITEEIKERAKKAAEDQVEREKAQREQAQREAQRARQPATQGTAQRVSPSVPQATGQRVSTSVPQGTVQRASPSAPQGKKAQCGCSRTLKLALGAAVVIGAILVLWAAFRAAGPSTGGDTDTGPGVTPTCAPLVTERRKCPWTPDGYSVEPCGPGFCWDGGPQGSLACKQEVGVENSHQNDLSVLVCNDGYYPERDPCTNVILRCVKQ